MIVRALKILLATAALVLCTGAAVVGYRLYTHPELRRAASATRELMELRVAGASDPGARALRDAGCAQAHAVGAAEFGRLLKVIDPALADRAPVEGAPGTLVDCVLAAEDASCQDLARAYVAGLERPPLTFAFTVDTASGARLCSGIFSQTGRRVRELFPGESSRPPDAVSRASRRPPATPAEPAEPTKQR